ncbi:hypothetical protein HN51_058322, partial [Arachis hypogaea]
LGLKFGSSSSSVFSLRSSDFSLHSSFFVLRSSLTPNMLENLADCTGFAGFVCNYW